VEDKGRKEAVRIRRYLAMAAEVQGALHSTEYFNVGPVIWFWFMFSNIRRQIIRVS
jgi:DMSO/TMAO reductase YedYZ heme-binding membrane subunit